MLLSDRALVNCTQALCLISSTVKKKRSLKKKTHHQTQDYTVEERRRIKELHYWEIDIGKITVKVQLE
jgi:hypothetical protein